jgi:hypothetical protein
MSLEIGLWAGTVYKEEATKPKKVNAFPVFYFACAAAGTGGRVVVRETNLTGINKQFGNAPAILLIPTTLCVFLLV